MEHYKVCVFITLFIALVSCDGSYNIQGDAGIFDPVRITTTGAVKGKLVKVAGREVLAFRGIPYAEPPVKENRFRKAVPIKPWQEVLDATNKPAPCMQTTSKKFSWVAKQETSEDCLYLNIWVPTQLGGAIASSKSALNDLPVMVWIHGGGYWSGSSALDLYDGASLAAYGNVIVASMNYRVGAFGFLYSGTPEAPGNVGLHDQILAMQWIQDNAKSFCGDPNKITLFGESAGAISIGLHLISPLSRNLFTRAIMQSGSPYHPALGLNPEIIKMKDNQFASSLGCANDDVNLITNSSGVMNCLRNLDAKDIVKTETVVLERVPYFFFPIYGDDFMPKSPLQAVDSGDIKRAEILIGNNKDEGSIFLNYGMPEVFSPQVAPDLPLAQARGIVEALFQQSVSPSAKQVAEFYLGNVTEGDSKTILKAIYDSFGDFMFLCPSVFLAEKASEQNDVYYYFFTHRPKQTSWGDWVGVAHFEEISFVFGQPLKVNSPDTNEECMFSHNIIQKWSSFARDGKPLVTPNETWPKYTSAGHQYLELNPKIHKIGNGPHLESCNFWRSYFTQM